MFTTIIPVLTLFLLAGCSPDPVSLTLSHLEKLEGRGPLFATAGKHKITYGYLQEEYRAYVRSHFPGSMWPRMMADRRAFREYGERVAIQTLILNAYYERKKKGKDAQMMLYAGMREALAEFQLRSMVDLSPMISNRAYNSMNEKMVQDLYKKNKKQYDAEKIRKKAALQSLRYVLYKRKKEILEKYLYSHRLETIRNLMRKYKYDIVKGKEK